MHQETNIIAAGLTLGLSAGLSPGPLMTLVITETLRFNLAAGVKVAIAPLLTDAPILLFAVFVLAQLAHIDPVLGIISLTGAGFLAYLAYESMRFSGMAFHMQAVRPHSIRKGVVANLLNPNPYMFWFAIGGPLIVSAYQQSWSAAFLFLVLFYIMLIGAKISVAIIVNRSRHFLKSRSYIWTIRALGCMLAAFAVMFLLKGLRHLGIMAQSLG